MLGDLTVIVLTSIMLYYTGEGKNVYSIPGNRWPSLFRPKTLPCSLYFVLTDRSIESNKTDVSVLT